MTRAERAAGLGMLVVLGLLCACGGTTTPPVKVRAVAAVQGPSTGTVLSTPPAAPPTPVSATCDDVPAFDAAAFPGTPRIDNPYLPLTAGMQFLLDGTVVGDDGKKHPHRLETTVTDLTKTIDGVTAVVIFERDLENAVMQESEIYFQAQDSSGAVWNLGEYPEEYSDGKLNGAPKSWLPGVAGAHPGIAMPAHPTTGTPTYTAGQAPSVGFKDCATVVDTARSTCAGPRCYGRALVLDEYAPLQAGDGHQEKFFALGVGPIRVAAAGGVDPEALQLTSATRLCPDGLARVDALALDEDHRAYDMHADLWAGTEPAARTLTAPACR